MHSTAPTRLRFSAAVALTGVLGSLAWIPFALQVRSAAPIGEAPSQVAFAAGALGSLALSAGAGAWVGGRREGLVRGALAGALSLSIAWVLLGLPAALILAGQPMFDAVLDGMSGDQALQRALIGALDRTSVAAFLGSWAVLAVGAVAGALGASLTFRRDTSPWTAPDLAWPIIAHLVVLLAGLVTRLALVTLAASSQASAESAGIARFGPDLARTAWGSTGLASACTLGLVLWATVPRIRHGSRWARWNAAAGVLVCIGLQVLAAGPGTFLLNEPNVDPAAIPLLLGPTLLLAPPGAALGWSRPPPRTPTWGDALSDAVLTTVCATVISYGIGGIWMGVSMARAVVPLIGPVRNGTQAPLQPLADGVLGEIPYVVGSGLMVGAVALVLTGALVFAHRWADGELDQADREDAFDAEA